MNCWVEEGILTVMFNATVLQGQIIIIGLNSRFVAIEAFLDAGRGRLLRIEIIVRDVSHRIDISSDSSINLNTFYYNSSKQFQCHELTLVLYL